MARSPMREGLDRDLVAEYLARMLLSVVAAPGGRDLSDRAAVEEYVRVELLGGVRPAV